MFHFLFFLAVKCSKIFTSGLVYKLFFRENCFWLSASNLPLWLKVFVSLMTQRIVVDVNDREGARWQTNHRFCSVSLEQLA